MNAFHRLSDLPRAIWMPSTASELPNCYQGSPLEMVQEMASEMQSDLGVHDAIDVLLQQLSETKRVHIKIPNAEQSEEKERAAIFVAALLVANVARPMPTPPS